MSNILVTGANRGIGLQLAMQLKNKGYDVYATCRKASSELQGLEGDSLTVLEGVDVGSDALQDVLKQHLGDLPLEIVINCAGVLEGSSIDHLDFDSILKQFQVNSLGPLRVVQAVKEQIVRGGKIAMITSRMGSIEDNTSGGSYGYRMSKVALNMASVSLAQDLKPRQIAVAIIHPGYVQTEMTGFGGHISPEQSAQGIIERIDQLDLQNSGTFWHQDGQILPW